MNIRRLSPTTESVILAATFPRIEPLPADYPHANTLRACERHGLELYEVDEWRRLVNSKQFTSPEAAEIVRRSRG